MASLTEPDGGDAGVLGGARMRLELRGAGDKVRSWACKGLPASVALFSM